MTITDLNDYLAPSQACIVASGPSAASSAPAGAPAAATVTLHSAPRRAGIIRGVPVDLGGGGGGGGGEASAPVPVTAGVSLSDCLACSGCVTSAETVLMEQQSSGELRRLLRERGDGLGVVVMLAPQALASLALYLGTPDLVAAYGRLAWFFKAHLGCAAVVDTVVGLDCVLAEAGDEVLRRLGAAATPTPSWVPPPCSLPVSSSHQRASASAPAQAKPSPLAAAPPAPLPVLSSACPGWVCYAEKSAPEALPYASSLRSPQQATGSLVKALVGAWAPPPPAPAAARVATVAVMPCYEKKLEASRKDFEGEGGAKEVDCVLVASEVVDMLVEEGFAGGSGLGVERVGPGLLFSGAQAAGEEPAAAAAQGVELAHGGELPWAARLESLLRGVTPSGALARSTSSNGESDGLCVYAYRHVARVLVEQGGRGGGGGGGGGAATATAGAGAGFSALRPLNLHLAVPFVAGRNADFKEATLRVEAGALEWLRRELAAHGPQGVRSLWRHAGRVDSAGSGGESSGGAEVLVPLSFFLAYGFRNIQGILSRLKKRAGAAAGGVAAAAGGGGATPAPAAIFSYVEIMACPKGCTNGGGLAGKDKSAGSGAAAAAAGEFSARVAELLHGGAPSRGAGAVEQERERGKGEGDDGGGEGNGPPYHLHDPHQVRERLLARAPFLLPAWEALVHTCFHNIPPLQGEAAGLAMAQKW